MKIYYTITRPIFMIWDYIHGLNYKYGYYRIKYRFDVRDTWDLDNSFCKWIIPRLKVLKEDATGYPGSLKGFQTVSVNMSAGLKKWQDILQEMIDGFQAYLNDDLDSTIGDTPKLEKSLELFKKYFLFLWS